MPSPIAHSSIALLARPMLGPDVVDRLPRTTRVGLYALIVFTLCAPDLDFLLRLLPHQPAFVHGGMMHSFTAAAVLGVPFAAVARWGLRIELSLRRLWMLGTACVAAHVLMDACTAGRGVMLLWPMWDERVASPVPLFYGVEHSQPWAWRMHLITIVSELAFTAAVWLAAWWWRSIRHTKSTGLPGTERTVWGEVES